MLNHDSTEVLTTELMIHSGTDSPPAEVCNLLGNLFVTSNLSQFIHSLFEEQKKLLEYINVVWKRQKRQGVVFLLPRSINLIRKRIFSRSQWLKKRYINDINWICIHAFFYNIQLLLCLPTYFRGYFISRVSLFSPLRSYLISQFSRLLGVF